MITNPALPGIAGPNLSGEGYFSKLLPAAVTFSLIAGSVIFLFMLIWGAIEWISSGGDKQHLESARGRITNALVGIVILFATFAIVSVLETFFGIKILTLDITPLIIQ